MSTSPPRILIADDHSGMRDLLARMLHSDYEIVDSVGDGASLISAWERAPAELLLIDIDMPIMNGLEALATLRARGCEARIIILTASMDSDLVETVRQRGADGFVVKERMGRELPKAIRSVLNGRTCFGTHRPGATLTKTVRAAPCASMTPCDVRVPSCCSPALRCS